MNDLNRCPRCLKLTDGIHTCTATPQWLEMELTVTNLRQQIAHLDIDLVAQRSNVEFFKRQRDELLSALNQIAATSGGLPSDIALAAIAGVKGQS